MRTRINKEFGRGKLLYVVEAYETFWFVHRSYEVWEEGEALDTAKEMSLFNDYKSYMEAIGYAVRNKKDQERQVELDAEVE